MAKKKTKKSMKDMRVITSDDINRIYSDLEFVKEVLDIAEDKADSMISILNEALLKVDALMGFIVDLPKSKEVTA